MVVIPSHVLSLFSCYAREDATLHQQFDKHLAMLKQLGWCHCWSERDIPAGAHRQEAINQYLCTVDILLLFVSADFLNSEYGSDAAMQWAVRRHQGGHAVVIPILLRPVEWQKNPLGFLQMLPRDAHPVTSRNNPDEAFTEIAAEIRGVIEALRRPVVLVSTLSHQMFATHLVQDLSTSRIPIWQETSTSVLTSMKEGIREAAAVVVIASSDTISNDSVKEAMRLSDMYQRPVVGVWIPDGKGEDRQRAPSMGNRNKWIGVVRGQEDLALWEIRASLHGYRCAMPSFSMAPSQEPGWEPRNPYKGLRAFTATDACDFFGRTSVVETLLTSVETIFSQEKRGQKSAHLLTVVGASGSGKSSVVKAGLLPALQAGEVLDSASWVCLEPIVPGTHPVDALVLAFFEYFPEKTLTMLRDDLFNASVRGLHWLATMLARRQGCTHVALVVDQFEEIFTLTLDEKERQQFFDLLVTACTQPDAPLIAVLTLRADFYDRLMQYPALYTLISEHLTPLLPMELPDLRAVITRPARLPGVKLTFEEHLVGDMLFDIQGQSGALPLLQFTLDQLFMRREGRTLTLQAYQEIGGVKGALARHAEETYQALPKEAYRESARTLFLRLIDPGMTEQDTTRRRATRTELVFADPEQTRLIQETMDVFVKARLLTVNACEGTETTIEVSHEAVIREWKRLAAWLQEVGTDIHFQQFLSKDVAEWHQHKRSQDRLYRGVQLKEARDWAKRNKPNEQEAAFLRASVTRRVLSLVSLMVVALVLVSSVGVAGWFFLSTRPASTTLVTTLDDNTNGGSLRYCIENAPSGSKIVFAKGLHGTIHLTGDLTLPGDKKLTIVDPGKQLAISGDDRDVNIHVMKNAIVDISGLTFKNSQTDGNGFLFNEGTLTLSHSNISDNWNSSDSIALGGAIHNTHTGILKLTDVIISNNTANSNGGHNTYGGAIDNQGQLTLTNSALKGNNAQNTNGQSYGGGIYNTHTGTLTVIGSTLSNNTASDQDGPSFGGGIYNAGTLSVTNSSLSNNTANGQGGSGFGGGIDNTNAGTLSVTNSSLSNNTASSQGANGFGGAIDNDGQLILTNSTLSKNTASSQDGNGFGGAIDNTNTGTLSVAGSILSSNTARSQDNNGAGGAIDNDGKLTLINSTLLNNTASSRDGDGSGGAIASSGTSVLNYDTIYGNTALSSQGQSSGGGIATNKSDKTIKMGDSIVFENKARNGPDIAGSLNSAGYNLIQDNNGTDGLSHTDSKVTLPTLNLDSRLHKNGGPTQTLALLPGSVAIDAAPCTITITDATDHPMIIKTDQRNYARPDDSENMCDIGAYEAL